MKQNRHAVAVAVALVLSIPAAVAAEKPSKPAPAGSVAQSDELESRLSRLERLLDSQILVDMVSRIEALQQEIRELRGQIEQQGHTVNGLKSRQRELYLDIDRRLSRIEREGAGTPSAAVSEPSTPAPTVPEGPAIGPTTPELATTSPGAGSGPESPARGGNPSMTGGQPGRTAPPAPSPADIAAEREAYQQAFDLLRELRYDQAIAGFSSFLQKYPEGRYAHIAQYWLGEANYARRDFQKAIESYQELISRYPQSPKVAEAMLKIGYSQYELGNTDDAKRMLMTLTGRYPDTTEAGQAQKLLDTIRRASSS